MLLILGNLVSKGNITFVELFILHAFPARNTLKKHDKSHYRFPYSYDIIMDWETIANKKTFFKFCVLSPSTRKTIRTTKVLFKITLLAVLSSVIFRGWMEPFKNIVPILCRNSHTNKTDGKNNIAERRPHVVVEYTYPLESCCFFTTSLQGVIPKTCIVFACQITNLGLPKRKLQILQISFSVWRKIQIDWHCYWNEKY